MRVDRVQAFPLNRLAALALQIFEHDLVFHQRPLHAWCDELARCPVTFAALVVERVITVLERGRRPEVSSSIVPTHRCISILVVVGGKRL